MPSSIPLQYVAKASLTITLASLAAAAARQSTMVANNSTPSAGRGYPAAIVYVRMRSGAVAPTAGKVYEAYLLRGDDPSASTFRTDGAGATDAAITIENAQLLGTLVVTATTAKDFRAEFDTAALGPLGPEWGIAIKNATDQTVDATGSNFLAEYVYYVPEAQ